jgi:hypothetical protein
MWESIDLFVKFERNFTVLEMLVSSIDRLWAISPDEARRRLYIISQKAKQFAPAEHHIHEMLAETYLFQYLRTGDAECEALILQLIEECGNHRASHAISVLLGHCRGGGWMTVGDGTVHDVNADAIRNRTWRFFSEALKSAQNGADDYRGRWNQLQEKDDAESNSKALQTYKQNFDECIKLVDQMALQLYFASGAYDGKSAQNGPTLNDFQIDRFWKDASPVFERLSVEIHPHTVYHIVQTLRHLLRFSPREIFILAAKSICASASAGFQHEPLAVGEVVKLIQQALADHRDILQNATGQESECLHWLLKVLDIFVEAGWPEARQLTHRLEEIYR